METIIPLTAIYLILGLLAWKSYLQSPGVEIRNKWEIAFFIVCGPLAWLWFFFRKPG